VTASCIYALAKEKHIGMSCDYLST
jgi:hypothetical protein